MERSSTVPATEQKQQANNQFTTQESFFCKWEHGAKEYFSTIEEARERAKSSFIRKKTMTDENYEYWSKQKYFIGKELVIIQTLETITSVTIPAEILQ
jgi:hypothetical protein